jgi:hypothetical protein
MVKYTLSEYSSYTGCGHTAGSAGRIEDLPWEEIDGLNTYGVRRGSVDLAEFEGHEALAAWMWLVENAGYDGVAGVKAWKGECSWCGGRLCDGKCGCEESVFQAAQAALQSGRIVGYTVDSAFAGK